MHSLTQLPTGDGGYTFYKTLYIIYTIGHFEKEEAYVQTPKIATAEKVKESSKESRMFGVFCLCVLAAVLVWIAFEAAAVSGNRWPLYCGITLAGAVLVRVLVEYKSPSTTIPAGNRNWFFTIVILVSVILYAVCVM